MILTCQVCGEQFEAGRSDAKTCTDACRIKRWRRRHDPGIGNPERRHRQRAGLDIKYAGRQHAQAKRDLQRLGLVPTHWIRDPRTGEWSPQFDGPSQDTRRTHARPRIPGQYTQTRTGLFAAIAPPTLVFDDDPTKRLWSPSDSFENHEVYIGFRDGGRPPPRGWRRGPHWPRERPLGGYDEDSLRRYFANTRDPIYERMTDAQELGITRGAPFRPPSPIVRALMQKPEELDKDQLQAKYLATIQRLWKEKPDSCPICGNPDWGIADLVQVNLRPISTFGDLLGTPQVYVYVPIGCLNCGYTMFFPSGRLDERAEESSE